MVEIENQRRTIQSKDIKSVDKTTDMQEYRLLLELFTIYNVETVDREATDVTEFDGSNRVVLLRM